jgi:PhzF family phenazine biosynthesis protein
MKIYQVDAFAAALFQGNPAAVVPLTEWLPDEVMQKIAMENNLAETAFIVPATRDAAGGDGGYDYTIRWFTPAVEVELCGHATLASGHVVFKYLGFEKDVVVFRSLHSGELKVSKLGGENAVGTGTLRLDFPADVPELAGKGSGVAESVRPTDLAAIFEGLKITPRELYRGRHDFMVVMDSQEQLETLDPDFKVLAGAKSRGVVVTAPGKDADFVSRCFFPQSGIDEDPVTGSAHTMMIPFWAARLGKNELSAIQLSKRRGYLECTLAGDRVLIGGKAFTYLAGEFFL